MCHFLFRACLGEAETTRDDGGIGGDVRNASFTTAQSPAATLQLQCLQTKCLPTTPPARGIQLSVTRTCVEHGRSSPPPLVRETVMTSYLTDVTSCQGGKRKRFSGSYVKCSHYRRIAARTAPAFNKPERRRGTDYDGWAASFREQRALQKIHLRSIQSHSSDVYKEQRRK